MAAFAFPNTVYDQPDNLLATLGSWWASAYAGTDQVGAIVQGRAQLENQSMLDLLELLASMSRFTVPIYHTDTWFPLYLRASQRNDASTSLLRYDEGAAYDSAVRYDGTRRRPFHAFPCPARLVEAPLLLNRFVAPTMTQSSNLDYVLVDGSIIFRNNPFDDPRVATRVVYTDGVPTDTEALIWVFRGQFDWDTIYRQFGYVIGLRLKSSAGYRELMNAVYDAMLGGTTQTDILQALSAMTGVPLVREASETVVDITADSQQLLIITDLSVYKFDSAAVPLVTIGQTLQRGQALTDALQIHELNCGVVPASLPSLAMGPGFLTTCFYSDIVFEDKDVSLVVDAADPSGYTKVRWGLGGFPLDVDHFFDELHRRGVAEAERPVDACDVSLRTVRYPANDCDETERTVRSGTLAHLLDLRPVSVGEPTAAHLPRTINPLRFLVANVLRNNAYIVRVRAATTTADGVGLHNVRLLRKVIPPHTAMILIVDLTAQAELITVSQITEQVATFTGMEPLADTIITVSDSRLSMRVVGGSCQ